MGRSRKTEVPRGADDGYSQDETFSFTNSGRNERAKAISSYPCLRSYNTRRHLSYVGIAAVFILIGAFVWLDVSDDQGYILGNFGKSHTHLRSIFWNIIFFVHKICVLLLLKMGYEYVHTTIITHMRDIIYNLHLTSRLLLMHMI